MFEDDGRLKEIFSPLHDEFVQHDELLVSMIEKRRLILLNVIQLYHWRDIRIFDLPNRMRRGNNASK